MAYVRRRLLKDGKTVVYLAMWREHAQGKELSRSFERKADAERHLVDMQHRLLTGTYKVTLDIYGHLWPGEEDRVRDAIGRLFRPDALRGAQG